MEPVCFHIRELLCADDRLLHGTPQQTRQGKQPPQLNTLFNSIRPRHTVCGGSELKARAQESWNGRAALVLSGVHGTGSWLQQRQAGRDKPSGCSRALQKYRGLAIAAASRSLKQGVKPLPQGGQAP